MSRQRYRACLRIVLLSLFALPATWARNLLPAGVSALDTEQALSGVRYLGERDYPRDPKRFRRIVSTSPYRGAGCLEFTSFGPKYGFVIFPGPAAGFAKGETFTASAYVRAPSKTQVMIYVWSDDGAFHPYDQVRKTAEVSTQWRQISVTGKLTRQCERVSVLIRVHPQPGTTRYAVLVDDVRLERGNKPSPSSPEKGPVARPTRTPQTTAAHHENSRARPGGRGRPPSKNPRRTNANTATPGGRSPLTAEAGATGDRIRFIVPRIARTPKLDGILDDASWETAPLMSGFTLRDRDGTPAPQATKVRMLHDGKALYVAAWCEEENLDALRGASVARDRPDWNDDRIELFLNVLAIPTEPTFYLSINAFGVTCDSLIGGTGRWDPELNLTTGRDADGWTAEFRIPFAELGVEAPGGSMWTFNIGRHHRTSCNASSQLMRYEQGFHEPPYFERMLLDAKQTKTQLRVVSLSRGEMSPTGNQLGTNHAVYRVENEGDQAADVVFVIENHVAGKRRSRHVLTRTVAPGRTVVSQPYTTMAVPNESLVLNVFAGRDGGKRFYHLVNHIDRLRPYRVVPALDDPLFGALLQRRGTRPERTNWHITWPMPIAGLTYCSAIQFGCANSFADMHRTLTKARHHVLHHYVPDLPCIDRAWSGRFNRRWNPDFERLAKGAREHGLAGPILYASYYLIGVGPDGKAGTNFFGAGFLPDPVNRNAFAESAAATVRTFGRTVRAVCAGDEQTSRQLHVLERYMNETPKAQCDQPFLLEADKVVRERYGNGKYGIPWGTPKSHPDYPYQRRALLLWLRDELHKANCEMARRVREVIPEMVIVGEDGHHGTTLSLELQHEYADVVTAQFQHRQPHDYTYDAKQLRDLSGIREVKPVPHDLDSGFPNGRLQPDELRELYSQALRGGATGFHFWPAALGAKSPTPPLMACASQGNRLAWDTLIAVSHQVNELPPLKFPKKSTTALFVSRNTRLCAGQTGYAEDYALFRLLGPELRGWFTFVSDAQLALKTADLGDFRLLFVPNATYADTLTADAFLEFCSKGGTLVSCDPHVLEHNVDGTSLADRRSEIFGIEVGGFQEAAKSLTFADKSDLGKGDLPVDSARSKPVEVRVTDGEATVQAVFDNGSPAIVEKRHGKGRAIYVAWSFCNSDLLLDTEWGNMVARLYKRSGGKTGHDIWRFTLPAVDLPKPERAKGRCLTGNHAFWYQYRLVRGPGNADTGGTYTITTAGKGQSHEFTQGRLTNRLRLLEDPNLSIALQGYGGYLKFKSDPWVERVTGNAAATVTFDFREPYPLDRAELFYTGALNTIVIETSKDGRTWTPGLTRTFDKPTGFREIVHLTLTLRETPDARFMRWVIIPGDTEAAVELVEAEVWAKAP